MTSKKPWPNEKLLQMLGIELPIIQAPMAGAQGPELTIAVSNAGGLGSLPCAALSSEQIHSQVKTIREQTTKPFNLNFFCHHRPESNPGREKKWRQLLTPYYRELGLDPDVAVGGMNRQPYDEQMHTIVLELRPPVVSFHFGLPAEKFVSSLKEQNIFILSSATTVDEALWLEAQGCDAVIAQGLEAGGHRAMFLSQDLNTQVGTMALVPQIVDALKIPVIASGGIMDGRGISAAFNLGAAAVQLGTAYLFCPEAKISPVHREALKHAKENETAITNVFSGRPARGITNRLMRELGPLSQFAPEFPQAGHALAPLRAETEPAGCGDFMPLWSGQGVRLGRGRPAGELTRELAQEALRG